MIMINHTYHMNIYFFILSSGNLQEPTDFWIFHSNPRTEVSNQGVCLRVASKSWRSISICIDIDHQMMIGGNSILDAVPPFYSIFKIDILVVYLVYSIFRHKQVSDCWVHIAL